MPCRRFVHEATTEGSPHPRRRTPFPLDSESESSRDCARAIARATSRTARPRSCSGRSPTTVQWRWSPLWWSPRWQQLAAWTLRSRLHPVWRWLAVVSVLLVTALILDQPGFHHPCRVHPLPCHDRCAVRPRGRLVDLESSRRQQPLGAAHRRRSSDWRAAHRGEPVRSGARPARACRCRHEVRTSCSSSSTPVALITSVFTGMTAARRPGSSSSPGRARSTRARMPRRRGPPPRCRRC